VVRRRREIGLRMALVPIRGDADRSTAFTIVTLRADVASRSD